MKHSIPSKWSFLFLLIIFAPKISWAQSTATADFSVDLTYTCVGTVQFEDLSTGNPTNWLWQFGDGGFSTQQHPTYTYANSGVYAVSLQISNAQGTDTLVKNAYITVEKPRVTSVVAAETCPNMTATLSATNGTGTLQWYDAANNLLTTGATFTSPPLNSTTTYFVEDVVTMTTTDYAGPIDGGTVGSGGYHGGGFTGGVNFTAQQAFDIVSVWVDADGAGNRTIYLYDGHIANGNNFNNPIISQVTVFIPDGSSRIQLNLQVPAAGDYCLAGNQMDLFRNNNGAATYPYSLAGVVDMVSATTFSNGFFYYFYNWELALSSSCTSAKQPVVAKVVNANFTSVISGGTASFTDASVGATNWLWDFGDGQTSTQQNPVHTYTTSNGPHAVTLTINNGLCSFLDSVNVSVGIEQLAAGMRLKIAPNPTTTGTRLEFSQALPEDLSLELIGINGKILLRDLLRAGQAEKSIDLSNFPAAVYWLRLSNDKVVEIQKIVKY